MSDSITVQHNGITITYDEGTNEFVFELRSRERRTPSLLAAKLAIDRPAPKNAKPFTRIPAFRSHYERGFTKVEITSIAGDRAYRSGISVWISDGTNRELVSCDLLVAVTPENENLIKAWWNFTNEISKLTKLRQQTESEMTRVVLPKEEE